MEELIKKLVDARTKLEEVFCSAEVAMTDEETNKLSDVMNTLDQIKGIVKDVKVEVDEFYASLESIKETE